MANENQNKKCAHAQCSCRVAGNEKYCSPACEAEERNHLTTIGCDCEHQNCEGKM
jgi:hypothetical protein